MNEERFITDLKRLLRNQLVVICVYGLGMLAALWFWSRP